MTGAAGPLDRFVRRATCPTDVTTFKTPAASKLIPSTASPGHNRPLSTSESSRQFVPRNGRSRNPSHPYLVARRPRLGQRKNAYEKRRKQEHDPDSEHRFHVRLTPPFERPRRAISASGHALKIPQPRSTAALPPAAEEPRRHLHRCHVPPADPRTSLPCAGGVVGTSATSIGRSSCPAEQVDGAAATPRSLPGRRRSRRSSTSVATTG